MQALVDSSNLSIRSIREGIRLENDSESKREFPKSKRNQLSIIERTLRVQGFIHVEGVPASLRTIVVDPLYTKYPARSFRIIGVNSGQRGGRKFTSSTLFGRRMLSESYYVLEWKRFSQFMSMKLEVMFRATNPNPPRQLKLAFTRFMHNFGFHWTECGHSAGD